MAVAYYDASIVEYLSENYHMAIALMQHAALRDPHYTSALTTMCIHVRIHKSIKSPNAWYHDHRHRWSLVLRPPVDVVIVPKRRRVLPTTRLPFLMNDPRDVITGPYVHLPKSHGLDTTGVSQY
jgi:hypothetical protein